MRQTYALHPQRRSALRAKCRRVRQNGEKFADAAKGGFGPHSRHSPSYFVLFSCATAAKVGKEPRVTSLLQRSEWPVYLSWRRKHT
jgi:hypothetical protein